MKTSFLALTFLFVGFALGWILRPTPTVSTTEKPSLSEGSILESREAHRTQITPGDTAKSVTSLAAILENGGATAYARAYQSLSGLSPKDLLSLIHAADSIGNDQLKWELKRVLIGRWSEIDPENLFAHALSTEDDKLKENGLSRAIEALASRNLARARALISKIEDTDLRKKASQVVLRATAKEDPKEAFATLSSDRSLSHEHYNIFTAWGSDAPKEAIEALASITNQSDRHQAIRGLASSWGAAEPEAALAWAMTLTNQPDRREAVTRVLGTVKDTAQGRKLLESLDLKGEIRKRAVNALANQVVQSDLDSAIAWIETLAPQERNDIIANQLYTISQNDPERAKQLFDGNLSTRFVHVAEDLAENLASKDLASAQTWVDGLPSGEIKDRATGGIIEALANSDPKAATAYLDKLPLTDNTLRYAQKPTRSLFDQDKEAALTWLNSQSDPKVKQRLTSQLLAHWSQQDPTAAMAYTHEIEDSEQQLEAQTNVLERWAYIDPKEAIQHYNTLNESDRNAALQDMVGAIAHSDIEAAIAFFESNTPPLEDRDSQRSLAGAADRLVSNWAEIDVEAAAKWSASLEQPEARTQAIDEAANEWIRQDSMAASQWIGELPAGRGRDAAVSRLIRHVREDDPHTAFTWAETLSDDNHRTRELENVLRQWKTTDPDGAVQALQSIDLNDKAYSSLLKQLGP